VRSSNKQKIYLHGIFPGNILWRQLFFDANKCGSSSLAGNEKAALRRSMTWWTRRKFIIVLLPV
jgi:hypothetical protein